MAPGNVATHTSFDFIGLAHRSFQLGGTLGPLCPRTFSRSLVTSVCWKVHLQV